MGWIKKKIISGDETRYLIERKIIWNKKNSQKLEKELQNQLQNLRENTLQRSNHPDVPVKANLQDKRGLGLIKIFSKDDLKHSPEVPMAKEENRKKQQDKVMKSMKVMILPMKPDLNPDDEKESWKKFVVNEEKRTDHIYDLEKEFERGLDSAIKDKSYDNTDQETKEKSDSAMNSETEGPLENGIPEDINSNIEDPLDHDAPRNNIEDISQKIAEEELSMKLVYLDNTEEANSDLSETEDPIKIPGSLLTEEKEIVTSGAKQTEEWENTLDEKITPDPAEELQESVSITPRLQADSPYAMDQNILKISRDAYQWSTSEEIQETIQKLEETLGQFGIEGNVVGIQKGPIIARYEVKMAPGIKVNKILSLTDELAMALEAIKVRIEAPIPGRSTIGIEIPNKKRLPVLLGDILTDVSFKEYEGMLSLPLGKDIAGNLVMVDLTKLPHLLIAGATGSGKSVMVNSFIINFILNKSPLDIRFLLIDPKLVELSQYNEIPHLLHPVITDPQKAVSALNWTVEEMERRYEDLAEFKARDITSYNEKINQKDINIPPMPYIILLIDELGDLMMVAGKDVESSIIRLSQKARAVGIHLILATQRPSVDVITALIKANCPARIALQVAQKTDSRTILDSNGAEQLLGEGDALFKHPARGQLVRIQAPLVKDEEVEKIVKEACHYCKPEYIILENPAGKVSKLNPEEEDLLEKAWEIILESQKTSASYLQRRLRIGYNKAARLIETFESRGYIGHQIGSKPREILKNKLV